MDDVWGRDEPPVTAGMVPPELPPRLRELTALTGPREMAPGERWDRPSARQLPEVAALMEQGWHPVEVNPLGSVLPAVWPRQLRCWVPDRLPHMVWCTDSRRHWVRPASDEERESLAQGQVEECAAARMPPPPRGRIWLLRSPWPSIGLDVVLHRLLPLRHERLEIGDEPGRLVEVTRDFLTWPESRVWSWWPGRSGDLARQWRQAGRWGDDAAPFVLSLLAPADVARSVAEPPQGAGLTEEQALAWCEALNVGEWATEDVLAWRALGLPADPPPELSDLHGFTASDAAPWLAAGFDLADVVQLAPVGVDVAVRWRGAGLSPERTRAVLDADPTLTPQELAAFAAAGIDEPDDLPWIASGFEAERAQQWRRLGLAASEARVWRSVGLPPADARAHLVAGGDVLPPGVEVGWTTSSPDPATRQYGVTDPPGTRGRIARRRLRDSRGRHYLNGLDDFDPVDFERAKAADAVQDASYLGTVYVRRLLEHEDRWTGLWVRGRDQRTIEGGKADVLRWALGQQASNHRIYDEAAREYVPLADVDPGAVRSHDAGPASVEGNPGGRRRGRGPAARPGIPAAARHDDVVIPTLAPEAQLALALASQEARRLRHAYLGSEHLLLGLLAAEEGRGRRALEAMGVTPAGMREQVEKVIGIGPAPGPMPTEGFLGFTPRVKRILVLADDERARRGASRVGSEHLLLALVREVDGVACQLLAHVGVDMSRVEHEVGRLTGEEPGGARP